MAVIIDIADAVVAEINGHTWVAAPPTPPAHPGGDPTPAFVAKRYYQPLFDLKEMSSLHVSVVPKAWSSGPSSRAANQEDHQIDIGVQKKLASGNNTEIDPLMSLVQEIGDFFRLRGLAAHPDIVCVKVENAPVYAPDHLQELRQFTSVLTLTLRVFR